EELSCSAWRGRLLRPRSMAEWAATHCEAIMTTKLSKPLKREIDFDGAPYVVTLSSDGLKIVEKGKRKGQEMTWGDLIGGRVGLTQSLKGSVALAKTQEDED